MTDRQKDKDLKEFYELLKQQIALEGNYDNECGGTSLMAINAKMEELQQQMYKAIGGKYFLDDVQQAAVAIAARALVIACNSKRELDAWEAMRA